MRFDDLDRKMRVYETAHDLCVLPGLHMVARLDGRGFTRLTKEVHPFEAPFDARFRELMTETAEHLMVGCGFNMVYGYTESDEISLLFALGGGRLRSEAPQTDLDSGRGGERTVLPVAGRGGRVRLPDLPVTRCGTCRRLLPLAGGRRPPQCPERPLLLVAAQAGQGRRRGYGGTERPVGRRQK